MNPTTKLSLIEKNHDEILDCFGANKEALLQALDDFFSCFLANPFKINYSEDDRQNYFELYLALKKQVALMEYTPTISQKLQQIKVNDVKEKYSKLDINFKVKGENNNQ